MSRVLVFRPAGAGQWTAFLLPSLIVLSTVGDRTAHAHEQQPNRELVQEATVLVTHALDAEAEGKTADRDELLQWALEKVPDFAPAQWHSGFIRLGDKWVRAEDVPQLPAVRNSLADYREMRKKAANTVKGQLQLADWCAKKGLFDQERAHLTRLLELEPNHGIARKRLHFARVNGAWLTQEEIQQARAHTQRALAAMKKWSPRLNQISRILKRPDESAFAEASARLREIADPDAIPALERALGDLNESAAKLLIKTLGQMSSPEASIALSRQAVLNPWSGVRGNAIEQLKTRSEDEYLPVLLSVLSTPIQSESEYRAAPNGRLIYDHAFYRETQDRRELTVLEASIQRTDRVRVSVMDCFSEPATPEQLDLDTFQRVAGCVGDAILRREAMRSEANERLEDLNERIYTVLEAITKENVPPSPEAWWKWWDDRNEVITSGEKPLQQTCSRSTSTVADASFRRYSCLAAGTPVWTASGAAPIEKIQAGDLVLSQDPETGELAYKPVLQTTIRPPVEILKFQTGHDTIRSTGGHAYWVAGSGWVKTRELKPGARLHTIRGSTNVESIEATGSQPAYNLVVAEFHTYFVGNEKLLSHDNTTRKAINSTPVGLPHGSTRIDVQGQKSSR